MKMPLKRLGNAYGKVFIQPTPFLPPRKEPGPKIVGKEEMGSARKPPVVLSAL